MGRPMGGGGMSQGYKPISFPKTVQSFRDSPLWGNKSWFALSWGVQCGGRNVPGVRAQQIPPISVILAGPATVGHIHWFAPQWGVQCGGVNAPRGRTRQSELPGASLPILPTRANHRDSDPRWLEPVGENSAHRVRPTRLAPRIIAPRDESPT